MTTITVTIPTAKAGILLTFKIKFLTADFDKVVDAVAAVTTVAELKSNKLWTII